MIESHPYQLYHLHRADQFLAINANCSSQLHSIHLNNKSITTSRYTLQSNKLPQLPLRCTRMTLLFTKLQHLYLFI